MKTKTSNQQYINYKQEKRTKSNDLQYKSSEGTNERKNTIHIRRDTKIQTSKQNKNIRNSRKVDQHIKRRITTVEHKRDSMQQKIPHLETSIDRRAIKSNRKIF